MNYSLNVTYQNEKYVAILDTIGKWFCKPYLEITKNGNCILKLKSYNVFKLISYFNIYEIETLLKSIIEPTQKIDTSFADNLCKQADDKNNFDCASILEDINQASLNGEYSRTIQLKVNQSVYFKSLGLSVLNTNRIGYYKISWKNEK